MSEFKILDSVWFTSGFECIGVVIGETITGQRKAYIKSVEGDNIRSDIRAVATAGAPFPLDAAYMLFKHLRPEE